MIEQSAHGLGRNCFESELLGRGQLRARETHIWPLRQIRAIEDVPQYIDRGIRLNCDTGLHAFVVDILDQLPRTGTVRCGFVGGIGRSDGGDGRLVVEAVQIAAGFLEFVDPFVRLFEVECQ